MNISIPSSFKQGLSAVILTCVSVSYAQAVDIPFGFVVSNTTGDFSMFVGSEVQAEVLNLNPTITNMTQGSGGIRIITSPFANLGDLFEVNGSTNDFLFDSSGMLISADFLGSFTNLAGVSFTIDFNAASTSPANVVTFARLPGTIAGANVSASVFPDLFNFVPTNSVPSPAPTALLGAGVLAFLFRSKRTQLAVERVV